MQRRRFMKLGFAAAAVPTIVPRHVLGGPGHTAPSERITLGGVGIGGVGHGQIKGLAKTGFQVEALCDVDDLHAKKTYDKFPQARRYRDFREMLAMEGDKIDAVYCGTPDHTHAFVTLAALRAKKHVCCVKPLTRSIEECYKVVDEAKKAGVATQVTATPWTNDAACRVREIIASGILGDIVEAYAWTRRPVWPQGMPSYPSFTTPVPGTLDWDLWLGSAEKRPYADKWPADNPIPKMSPEAWSGAAVYHPFNHRGWYDFGAGALGDMGCHWANTIYKALELGHPSMISASCTRASDVAFPLEIVDTYDYPKRGGFPELRLVWYDGLLKPPVPKEMKGKGLPKEGVLYVGTKATMLVGGLVDGIRILDPALNEKAKTVPRTLPRRGDISKEWLTACKGGEKAGCNFDWALLITEFVLLGNLAVRTGRAVAFDPKTLHVTNNPAADALLRLTYHNGWRL
ncbi:MAG: Gfo/Idh/MocA family oxidoreductase [Kiritimatiellae bacterium]|nr:Gfo/Idh/MocA family oxidoreductase [Kiritimatiellia bacterium]